ncbi:TonB-dependent receptor [Prevotella sp. MA2016]|uniref:SusC/RagA family TonB-linked outer membrane protein n=1 Tax=Prevotella sp. MA2016 TaxID=1408310 RepID=UPI00048A734D|nr:TonB-dependent receptor [Prevotella sp. MA2016]
MKDIGRSSLNSSWGMLQRLMFTVLFTVFAIGAFAQNKITGTVVDAQGEPIIGASVVIKGTSNGTVTDFDGKFVIANAPAKGSLVISYVGYRTQTISLSGTNQIKTTLEEDKQLLDEVVVVGYGVQRKSDVTGALTRVGEKELNAKPVNNAFEALQGKAAGVDITTSERPGTIGSIAIRGQRSISAGKGPLYVVDGVPLQAGGIETLNPRDIESIDILKDASSTAIYGSRGANGVVLVTTKRGQEGKMQVSYSGSLTFEKIVDKSPAMKASDYITWRRWAYYNMSPDKYTPGDQPNQEQDKNFFGGDDVALANVMKGWAGGSWDGSKVTDTDWTDMVTQTGLTQEHTLSARGGTKNVAGFVSFGYLRNEGTQKGQTFERYNFSASADVKGNKWFKLGGSFNASYGVQQYGYSKAYGTSSGPTDLYGAAKAILRYTLPYDENGDIITQPGGSTTNTYSIINEWTKSNDNRQNFRLLGSFYAQIDLGQIYEPLQGLVWKTQFGPEFRYYRNGNFLDSSSISRAGGNNTVSRGDGHQLAWTLDNMLMYNRTFGEHNVGLTLLQSASKTRTETSSISEENVPIPSFLWNNLGAVDVTDTKYKVGIGSGLTGSQLASYMARVNYAFMDRYLLTASARWDGASVLAQGKKWDFFPSMALGWRMEQEEFLKNVSWLDQLKLRLGVGVTGNAAVSPYGTLGLINSYWMPFSTGNSQILVTNEPYYSSSQVQMPNMNLGWEKTTQWNLGIDFSFLKGRIGGTIDLYTSRTNDLILDMSIPSLSGYPSMKTNVGKTKNKGVELTLNTIPVLTKDFIWNSNLNLAWQKDEIVELANGKEDDVNNAWFIGQSIAVYYGYAANGLWQESDAAEMAKFNENGEKFTAGNVRPVDQNGDYKINADDRVILGNKNPRFTAGWSNSFSWKGFELTIDLQGRFKYMVSTGGEGQLGMYQQREISYWRPDNTGADWQKPIYNQSGGDPYSGLLGFKNASFIKIRNLSLGYNFDKKLLKSIGLNGLKLYVQGRNLGMLYSSIDFMDLDTGRTYFNRGVTAGVQVDF